MSATDSRRPYFLVFAALMVLLVLTVGVSYLPYGRLAWLGVLVALTIAAVKAVLVALYFMHLKGSPRLVRIFVVSGIFWLLILFNLTLVDYLTRSWLPASRGWLERPVMEER